MTADEQLQIRSIRQSVTIIAINRDCDIIATTLTLPWPWS